MSVYVDALFEWFAGGYHGRHADAAQAERVGARNEHRWCHMIADTEGELHAMASRIGCRREWFQGDHYDLTPKRRAAAVAAGAVEVGRRELVAIRRRLRARAPATGGEGTTDAGDAAGEERKR